MDRTFRIFFFWLVLIPKIQCECIESYATICDTIEDIFTTKNNVTFREIIVQSNKPKSKNDLKCLDIEMLYTFLRTTYSVTFIEQLDDISTTECRFFRKTFHIKSMTFHKNILTNLKIQQFLCHPLRKLSLVNNNIRTIGTYAFTMRGIKEIDLSENQITIIRKHNGFTEGEEMRVLKLKKNKIAFIEPNSFPTSLELLDLSYNEISGVLRPNVIDNLTNLEYLYLSNNKINVIPDISKMKNLTILDVSYNKIFIVEWTLENKPALTIELINLSHNEIESIDFLYFLVCDGIGRNVWAPIFQVALHFNSIKRNILSTPIECNYKRHVHLSLYGNPWSCMEWNAFQKIMKQEQRIDQLCCDKLHFSSGLVPYCVAEDPYYIDHSTVQNFLNVVKKQIHLVGCNLNHVYCSRDKNKQYCNS